MLMCTFLHSTTIDVTRDNLQRASSLCLPLLCAPSFSRRKAAIERCRVLVSVAGVVHTGALCDSSADFPAVECSRTRCTVPAVTARRALVRLSPTFRLTTPSASPRGAPFLPAMAGILATVPLWLRVLGAAELQRCHGCAVRVAGATARGVQLRVQKFAACSAQGGGRFTCTCVHVRRWLGACVWAWAVRVARQTCSLGEMQYSSYGYSTVQPSLRLLPVSHPCVRQDHAVVHLAPCERLWARARVWENRSASHWRCAPNLTQPF